jgi:DNA-binding NtrC family response regulator
VLCDSAMLDVCDFPQIAAAMGVEAVVRPPMTATTSSSSPAAPALSLHSAYALPVTDAGGHIRKFEDLESEIIRMAISRYDGHMSEVARRLGIGRSTLYRKLKEFGLEPEGHVAPDASDAETSVRKAG